jgi:alkylation response protein AidB-like acyl-CoA dehydrogenase
MSVMEVETVDTTVGRMDHPIDRNSFSDTTGMTNTAQRLLADIQELAPEITLRAAEIEAGRRIPPDLVEALRSIAVFRMFVPQSHGGLELDLPTALKIVGALSRIDGSVGWIATIAAGCASSRLCCRGRHTSTSTRTART